MDIANNPATALEGILRAVVQSGGTTVTAGWERVLEASVDSPEFAMRHGEVVGLFHQVHTYLVGLEPDDVEHVLYLKYVPAWYGAVVFRDRWNHTGIPAGTIIKGPELDHLQGLGVHLRLKYQNAQPDLGEGNLANLTQSLREWRDLLDGAELPSNLAHEIKSQVDHIEWLLSNVEMFGAEPVARGARTLLGLSVPVLALGGKMVKAAGVAMAGLLMFLTPIEVASDKATNILTNFKEAVQTVEELGAPEPQKALPAPNSEDDSAEDPSKDGQVVQSE